MLTVIFVIGTFCSIRSNSRSRSTWLSLDQYVLLYGAECRTVRKKEEKTLDKTEFTILRRIKGVTLRDRIKSINIRKA